MGPAGFSGPDPLPWQLHGGHVQPNTAQDPFAEQRERVLRQNAELQRQREEEQAWRRREQMIMSERQYDSANGADLKPVLSAAGEEYALLHGRNSIDPATGTRNYMGGVGLFLSRAGFATDFDAEHTYGYAHNNPMLYIDPAGAYPDEINNKVFLPVPYPLSKPRASCQQVRACLSASGSCGQRHPEVSREMMTCVFWQEGNFNPAGNSNLGKHEGMGNLTLDGFKELCAKKCSSVRAFCRHKPAIRSDYDNFLSSTTVSDCQKAQAAFQYLTLVGLGSYGPSVGQGSYRHNLTLQNSILACEACLQNPMSYFCLNPLPTPRPSTNDYWGLVMPFPPPTGSCQSCLNLVRVHPFGNPKGYEPAL